MALTSTTTFITLFTFLATALAAPVPTNSTLYFVPGVGTFNHHLYVDFTHQTTFPGTLLSISDYAVSGDGEPYAHHFDPSLVALTNSSLTLTVPGGSSSLASIPSAEITTAYSDILYGSISVVASHDDIYGTCKGMFFYRSDSQETDIEILSNDQHNLTGVWFTNQKSDPEAEQTTKQIEATGPGWHEYRTDWVSGSTSFYVDGVLKGSFASNVAWEPSAFVINNWSNGDSFWSAGPPIDTSVLRIKSVEGFFNRTADAY